jgi:SAM-dependent methyltransferase
VVASPPWDVAVEQAASRETPLWRLQSDMVNRALLERWLPTGLGSVLKTDLFDECVSDGLYPELALHAGQVAGVDVSPAVVAAAGRRHRDLEATVTDVRALPFEPESFDAVVSNSTLDHLDGTDEVVTALGEIHRVMRPGGRLVLTVDNPYHPLVAARTALPAALARVIRPTPYPSAWTCGPNTLADLLRRAGFQVLETTAILHFPRVIAAVAGSFNGTLAQRRRVTATLRRAERLERWPTRFVTGHFIATLAVRPALSPADDP